MSDERRRYNRFVIEKQNIHLKTVIATEIYLLDISSGGACVKSTRSLRLGGEYIFRLETNEGMIPLKCHIVWENLHGNIIDRNDNIVPQYIAGLEFRDINADQIEVLESFIDSFHTPGSSVKEFVTLINDKRLSGIRFKLPTPENAMLNGNRSFTISKISIGGLAVISDIKILKDTPLSFELFLHENERPLGIDGRVASCTPITSGKNRGYDIGIEFIKMTDDDTNRLVNFIHSL